MEADECMEACPGHSRTQSLPHVEVEHIYYVHPIGLKAKEAVARYLAAIGLDPEQSQILVRYGDNSWMSWRVDHGFLLALHQERLAGDWHGLEFLVFRHPNGDPAVISEYSLLEQSLGGTMMTRGDRKSLGRAVGIHPKIGKKRK